MTSHSIETVDKLREAAKVWCPEGSYPRRVGRHQESKASLNLLVNKLSSRVHDDGYVSVYGFPRGHSSEGAIPKVDTLMLDFDVPGDQYSGDGDMEDWSAEMSDLLARVRLVAGYLADEGKAHHYRFSLSGHKGVHIYLDFPEINPVVGDLEQFKAGMSAYTSALISFLESEIGINLGPWLDVDSSDMGRLTRMPNTKHPSASKAFGNDRFCVPVTANELRDMTVADYWALTSTRRHLPDGIRRDESERATVKITEHIHQAEISGSDGSRSYDASYNAERVEEYKQNANDGYDSVDDLWLFLEDKPCIKAYFERDGDQFRYGNASHTMELFVISKLVNMGVPYDLIVEFFESMGADGFNPNDTRKRLDEVIARNYNEFNCEKVWQDASQFCLGDSCSIYNRNH